MKKKEIMEISLDMIVDKGLENFSMRKLADEMNCKASSLYHYFKTKDEILNELFICSFLIINSDFCVEGIYPNFEEMLYNYYSISQKYRNEYIFIKNNFYAQFLNEEAKQLVIDFHLRTKLYFEKNYKNNQYHVTNYLISAGPLNELVNNKDIHLNEDDLRLLVRKIIYAIKGE